MYVATESTEKFISACHWETWIEVLALNFKSNFLVLGDLVSTLVKWEFITMSELYI